MKPIQLTLENFRSFRKAETVSFGAGHLRAIIGDTGAGKSSILHAITYALFNTTQDPSLTLGDLIANGAKSASVTFTFEVDGQEWTIQRAIRRTGTFLNSLRRADGSETFGSAQAVKEKIIELLGMNSDVFLKTVSLPQGRYQALLIAKDAERQNVLRSILGLQVLPRMADLAAHRGRDADRALSETQQHAKEFEHVDEQLAAAHMELGDLERRVRALTETQAAAKKLQGNLVKIANAIVQQTLLRERLESAATLIGELEKLDTKRQTAFASHAELKKRRGVLDEGVTKADALVAALAAQGRDRETLDGVQLALHALDREFIEIERVAAGLGKATFRRKHLTSSALAMRAIYRAARLKRQSASNTLREVAEALQSVTESIAKGLQQQKTLSDASLAYRSLQEECKNAATAFGAAETIAGNASKALEIAKSAHDEAEVDLRRVELANHAAAAAQHLLAGDSCPVCASVIPRGFRPPTSGDIVNAQRGLAAARVARESAIVFERNAAESLVSERSRYATIAESTARKEKDLNQVRESLRQSGSDEATLAQNLVELNGRRSELAGQAEEHEKGEADARKAAQDARDRLLTSAAELRAKRLEQRGMSEDLDNRKIKVARDARKLPKALALKRVDRASCEARVADVRELLVEANGILAQRDAAMKERADLQTKLDLAQKELSEIAAPWTRVLERFGQAVRDVAGHAIIESLEDARAAHESAIIKLNDLKTIVDTLGQERDEASKKLEELLQPNGVNTMDELQELLTQARVAEGQAKTRLEQFSESLEKAESVRLRIEKLVPIAAASNSLRQLLHKDAFQQFVFQQRQQSLVEAGSTILMSMTGNRYAFTPQFDIDDRPYNTSRPAVSLSGGEQFIASLALALAVVQLAAAGGARIDALFLDEGFDALDPQSREHVMTIVRERAQHGRSITIITHVSQITEYVDETLLVKNTADGSIVTSGEDIEGLDGPLDLMSAI
jgi:exonuclease SbcC